MSKTDIFKVAVLAGDGIGPEVMAEALRVLAARRALAAGTGVFTTCEKEQREKKRNTTIAVVCVLFGGQGDGGLRRRQTLAAGARARRRRQAKKKNSRHDGERRKQKTRSKFAALLFLDVGAAPSYS